MTPPAGGSTSSGERPTAGDRAVRAERPAPQRSKERAKQGLEPGQVQVPSTALVVTNSDARRPGVITLSLPVRVSYRVRPGWWNRYACSPAASGGLRPSQIWLEVSKIPPV